jgi:hypothetical protein
LKLRTQDTHSAMNASPFVSSPDPTLITTPATQPPPTNPPSNQPPPNLHPTSTTVPFQPWVRLIIGRRTPCRMSPVSRTRCHMVYHTNLCVQLRLYSSLCTWMSCCYPRNLARLSQQCEYCGCGCDWAWRWVGKWDCIESDVSCNCHLTTPTPEWVSRAEDDNH